MRNSSGTQTLVRALDILFILTDAESTLSVKNIADKVNVPISTAYRLIKTLEQSGIIQRKSNGEIGLGMRILDLARSLYQQTDHELFEIALPIMKKLTGEINETSLLAVRTGLNVTCVQQANSTRLIQFIMENGRTLPLHLGASSKAILAFEDKKIVNRVFNTLAGCEKENLQKELELTRKNGYIMTFGEVDEDVFGLATPICDVFGSVIASLSIVGPENRFNKNERDTSIKVLLQATKDITNDIRIASDLIR